MISKSANASAETKRNKAYRAAMLHAKWGRQNDEQQLSKICAVGVSNSGVSPGVASAFQCALPCSDVDVEDSVLDADDKNDASYSSNADVFIKTGRHRQSFRAFTFPACCS